MEAANFGLWSATGPRAEPPVGVQGDLHPPDAENFAINLQQTLGIFLQ